LPVVTIESVTQFTLFILFRHQLLDSSIGRVVTGQAAGTVGFDRFDPPWQRLSDGGGVQIDSVVGTRVILSANDVVCE
jgi:hypothetical protein